MSVFVSPLLTVRSSVCCSGPAVNGCFSLGDRCLWVWVSLMWTDGRAALVMVKPATVIAWHRRGFRLFWTWKSRGRTGRPTVSKEVPALIRELSAANPLWGAPRIHGELLKLGISVSQS